MKFHPFEYVAPTSLAEATRILADMDGEARPIAGGQSLLPIMAFRLSTPHTLVDLRKIPDLRKITIDDEGVRLGAMVRWRDIQDDKRLEASLPLLADAIEHIAHYQIRNRGTVGGSLAHADPAAELPGIAVACDAVIEVVGATGARQIAAADLFTGPLETCLLSDEIITGVRFPKWVAGRRWAFIEFSRRRGDFALAGIALFYDVGAHANVVNAHVGVIGATDRPRRLASAEAALNGQPLEASTIEAAAVAASAEVEPMNDIHGSVAYRRSLVGTMVRRALAKSAV